uniref:Metallo-beta-lactamase domain-containing protein n=1 Tax=Chloropicon roscoffensis TaxID=1461544 RepID=A0A7S3FQY7_9CHLO|mmetsp:Transcript_9742/g.29634  ORF Transcript_9742/g.29634 Transcript_9742/m.29634 type:complete len:552 (+) Transcript_9742:23-1678(+)
MSWPTVSMATMASTTMTPPPPSRAPPRNESDPEDDDDFKEPKRMLTRKKRTVPRSMVKREWPQLGRPVFRREEPLDEGGREEEAMAAEVKENLCPICGKDLNEVSPTVLGRQAHINACLDKNPQKDEEGCSGRVDRAESGGLASSMATRTTTTRPASRPRPPPQGVPPTTSSTPPWLVQKQQAHVVRGTPGPFAVDCFQGKQMQILAERGTTSWFLSHFHSDHYMGLKKDFGAGRVYCTMVTAKLVHRILGVPLQCIYVLEIGKPCAVQGVRVTALDANHCPGACMFLFEPAGEAPTLHTGDARLTDEHTRRIPELLRVRGACVLALDTTYCSHKYASFPSQRRVVEAVAKCVVAEVASNPKVLVLVGSYTIGKEAVFFGVARALGRRVYIGANKRRVMGCLDLTDEEKSLVCEDDTKTNVHAVPLGYTRSHKKLESILKHYKGKYTGVVAVCPTGWSLDQQAQAQPKLTAFCGARGKPSAMEPFVTCKRKGRVVTYSVPYSEHSSYDELRSFVSWLQPKELLPFVRVSDQDALRGLKQVARAAGGAPRGE